MACDGGIWNQQFMIDMMAYHDNAIQGYIEKLYKIFFNDIRELDNIRKFKKHKAARGNLEIFKERNF